MAEPDRSPDPFESPRYLETIEAVPRLFANAFPKVDLLWFRAFRPEICGYYTRPSHKIMYAGQAEDLIAHGLLLPEMVPPGRKELCHYGEPGDPSSHAKRRAKGRIEVSVDRLPGPLPALARFGTERWPFFASARAAREYCRHQVHDTLGIVDAMTRPDGALATGGEEYLKRYGFKFHPDDRAAIAELTRTYGEQLAAKVLAARIEPIGKPALRVVK